MIFMIIYIFSVFVALALGVIAGRADFKGLKIPNLYPVLILLLFIPAALADHYGGAEIFSSMKSHLAAAGIVFIITFVLFQLKLFGGGDSKLLTVYSLWVGMAGLPVLLFYMALFGALLGAMALFIQKRKPFVQPVQTSWIGQLQAGESKVPYGIAITLGAIIAFVQQGYLAPQTLGGFIAGS